jgi:hypothetical protein
MALSEHQEMRVVARHCTAKNLLKVVGHRGLAVASQEACLVAPEMVLVLLIGTGLRHRVSRAKVSLLTCQDVLAVVFFQQEGMHGMWMEEFRPGMGPIALTSPNLSSNRRIPHGRATSSLPPPSFFA